MLTSAAQFGSHAFEMINVHLSKTLGMELLICLSYHLKIQGFSESTPADWKLRPPLARASTPVSGDWGVPHTQVGLNRFPPLLSSSLQLLYILLDPGALDATKL